MLDLSIVHSQEEFAEMREDWNRVLESSISKTIFLRWEWLYNWWVAYRTSANELLICVVRDHGQIIGIAPLFVTKKRIPKSNIISFLGSNIISSDYLDIIVPGNREREISRAIMKFLDERGDLWDIMELDSMPAQSPTVACLENYCKVNNIIQKSSGIVCPFVSLKTPWDTVWASYSPLLKNTIKRKLRKLCDQYQGHFINIPEEADVGPSFERFVQLNLMRFREKKLRSPFEQDAFVRFHRNLISDLHKKGMAKLIFVEVNRQFIAGIYIFVYNNKYYYYQSGYDPAWSHLSPGTLLFHHCIKTAHEYGFDEFDFLRGSELYKYSWTNTVHGHVNIHIYHNNGNNRALIELRRMKRGAKNWLRSMLNGNNAS